ncbi:hypothetical protein [Vibrio bivalvicida]|uniref:Uncharacterized protein n=1 Tax=Vibrio bivalvicida TaxID=1276888 RepID=A0ABV4MGH1_9VIBR
MKNIILYIGMATFCILTSFVASASMKSVGLTESGVSEHYPVCSKEPEAICFSKVEIDNKNQVFITIFIDIDSLPQFNSDDTSTKINGIIGGMNLFLALFNPRYPKPIDADNKLVQLNLGGGNQDDIIILAKAIVDNLYYSGFAYLDKNNGREIKVGQTQLSPIEYYESEIEKESGKNE